MQKIQDIQKLVKDREEIIKILNEFSIEALKIEKKNNSYIVSLGGIDKILFTQNKLNIENKFKEDSPEINLLFK